MTKNLVLLFLVVACFGFLKKTPEMSWVFANEVGKDCPVKTAGGSGGPDSGGTGQDCRIKPGGKSCDPCYASYCGKD